MTLNLSAAAIALTLATCGSAVAQTAILPPAEVDWTGPYVGVNLSYDNLDGEDLDFALESFRMTGSTFAVTFGYDWQFSSGVVIGAQGVYAFDGASGKDQIFFDPAETERSAQIKFRAGYATGRFLPYVSAGLVVSEIFARNSTVAPNDDSVYGYSYGLGTEYMVTENVSLRAEIERINYGTDPFVFRPGGGLANESTFRLDGRRLTVGAAYRY